MTPTQKIKHELLLQAKKILEGEKNLTEDEQEFLDLMGDGSSGDLGEQWDALTNIDLGSDLESEFRRGQVETGLLCERSRHYSSKSVAAKLSDGSWVGWTYWYGGGKHGEPGAIEWMENAYDLEVTETEKPVTVTEFKRLMDGAVGYTFSQER